MKPADLMHFVASRSYPTKIRHVFQLCMHLPLKECEVVIWLNLYFAEEYFLTGIKIIITYQMDDDRLVKRQFLKIKSRTLREFLVKLSLSEDFFKFSFSALSFFTRSCKCFNKSALLDFSTDREAAFTLGDWKGVPPFDDVVVMLREVTSRFVL